MGGSFPAVLRILFVDPRSKNSETAKTLNLGPCAIATCHQLKIPPPRSLPTPRADHGSAYLIPLTAEASTSHIALDPGSPCGTPPRNRRRDLPMDPRREEMVSGGVQTTPLMETCCHAWHPTPRVAWHMTTGHICTRISQQQGLFGSPKRLLLCFMKPSRIGRNDWHWLPAESMKASCPSSGFGVSSIQKSGQTCALTSSDVSKWNLVGSVSFARYRKKLHALAAGLSLAHSPRNTGQRYYGFHDIAH